MTQKLLGAINLRVSLLLSLFLLLGTAVAQSTTPITELAANVITVKQAYVHAIPAGNKNTGAFMEIFNNGKFSHTLIAATSSIAAQTQLQVTFFKQGFSEYSKARTRSTRDFAILPGKSEKFQPGGHKITFIDLKQHLRVGEKVNLVLVFSDGSSKTIMAPVRAS